MKKVLFLIHTLGGGGAEKVLVNLVNNLDSSKYDITVMTVVDVGELRSCLNDNIKYKTTIKIKNKKAKNFDSDSKSKSGSLLGTGGKLKKTLAKFYANIWKYIPTKLFYKIFIKEKYDVEISFLEGICAKIISSSSNKNSKKYAWIHVDLIKQKKSDGVFKNINEAIDTYKKFDNIVCVSKVVKSQFEKKYGIDSNKVIVKYNSIDKNDILFKSTEKILDYEKEKNFVTICSVGRLNAQKAYDRLLRITKRLKNEGYKIKLFIIGEGTSKNSLEEYIHENNLSSDIKLIGFKNNPYPYMKLCDLFVCSSIAEGFSTVVSEAIVLGKVIVTTDCSGMKEMLGENNEYGVVTDNDEDSLYMGIKYLLDNKEKYNYYQEKIIERFNMFDLDKTVKAVETLIDK